MDDFVLAYLGTAAASYPGLTNQMALRAAIRFLNGEASPDTIGGVLLHCSGYVHSVERTAYLLDAFRFAVALLENDDG